MGIFVRQLGINVLDFFFIVRKGILGHSLKKHHFFKLKSLSCLLGRAADWLQVDTIRKFGLNTEFLGNSA
jgi:hypothetical protein